MREHSGSRRDKTGAQKIDTKTRQRPEPYISGGTSPPRRYLRVSEIAERFSLMKSAAYRLADELAHVTIGTALRVSEDVVEAFEQGVTP